MTIKPCPKGRRARHRQVVAVFPTFVSTSRRCCLWLRAVHGRASNRSAEGSLILSASSSPSKGPASSGGKDRLGRICARTALPPPRACRKNAKSHWIGIRPALVRIEAESHARHGRVAASARDVEWIHAVKHPATEPHRLKHQHTCGA